MKKYFPTKVRVKRRNDPELQIKIALSKPADQPHLISEHNLHAVNHSSVVALSKQAGQCFVYEENKFQKINL